MSTIYSPARSKNHLIQEQQNKLLTSPVQVISESERIISEHEWISKNNQT